MASTYSVTKTQSLPVFMLDTVEHRHVQLNSLPTELQAMILCEAADISTIKNLTLSCKAYRDAYLGAEREILLALVRRTFDADDIQLQIPLLAVKAKKVDPYAHDHFNKVNDLLEANPEDTTLTEKQLLEISPLRCLQLLDIHMTASRICDDVPTQLISKSPITGDEQPHKRALSKSERRRITRSIYRWELSVQLFFDYGSTKQSKEARIETEDQVSIFINRYEFWEQEEMACICEYAVRRYVVLIEDAFNHFNMTNGPNYPDEPGDEFSNPHKMLDADSKQTINNILREKPIK